MPTATELPGVSLRVFYILHSPGTGENILTLSMESSVRSSLCRQLSELNFKQCGSAKWELSKTHPSTAKGYLCGVEVHSERWNTLLRSRELQSSPPPLPLHIHIHTYAKHSLQPFQIVYVVLRATVSEMGHILNFVALKKTQVLLQKSTRWANHFIEERQQITNRNLKRMGLCLGMKKLPVFLYNQMGWWCADIGFMWLFDLSN